MAGTIVIISVSAGAMAYQAEQAKEEVAAISGTLTLALTQVTEDLTNGNEIIIPGDSNDLKFTVQNTGTKEADVKAIIKISSEQIFTSDNYEYMVTTNEGEALEGVLSEEGKMIIYTLEDVSLEGVSGETVAEHAYDYQFAMREDVSEEWQGTSVDVQIEVYGKQHENTQEMVEDWTVIVEK